MARALTRHCCRGSCCSTTTTASTSSKALEHLGLLAGAELFQSGGTLHVLWVALLVSVVTTLLPKGLHAVQQQSCSSKALLKGEKKKEEKKGIASTSTSHTNTTAQFHCFNGNQDLVLSGTSMDITSPFQPSR